MIWQLVLGVLLVWFVQLLWKGRKLRIQMKQWKSDLNSLPIIGHIKYFVGGSEHRMSGVQLFSREAIKQKGWTYLHLGFENFGVVGDALEADYILKTHLEKNDLTKLSHSLIGNGLIFSSVSIWRPRRKVMAPTFSQHNLNQFVNIFQEQSSIMVDNLKNVADRQTFSVWKYFNAYSMDAACQTTLGTDLEIQKTSDHFFLKHFQQYADIVAKRIFHPWITNDATFKFFCYFGMYTQSLNCTKILKGFINDIIENKKAEIKANKENNNKVEKEDREKRGFTPILELLIEASGGEKGYSPQELQEESSVILVAGTDTSAVGLSFFAMMLARHPDIQEKCYKEIQDVYGDSDRPIKPEDLNRLSYLELVLKETMRLYPPVPLTARKIVKEDVTPAGIRLVPGIGVAISHWAIHRNPKYWGNDADEFRPERFIDSPPTHPSAYIPFSSGPRSCLGYKYAMMSMMTSMANLLRKFRILPPNQEDLEKPLRLTYEIMMKHANDFQLKLEPRE